MSYGWRQEALRDNAQTHRRVGRRTLCGAADHDRSSGRSGSKLSGSLESYNKLIGSFDRNVLSKARKLKEFGAAKDGKQLPEALEPIDLQARTISAIEPPASENAA